ncbi:MAG: hypothetical protein ACRCZ0_06280 [Cetobacterium sp.]
MRIFETISELGEYIRANNTKAFFSYEEVEPTHVVYDIYDIYDGDCKIIEKVGVKHIEITRGMARKILRLKRGTFPESIEKYYEKDDNGEYRFVWEEYIGEGIWDLKKKNVSRMVNGYLNIVSARFFFSDTTISVLDPRGHVVIHIGLTGLNF